MSVLTLILPLRAKSTTCARYHFPLRSNPDIHLRNMARLHPTLTLSDTEKLIHPSVFSRLDYWNTLLSGFPSKTTQRPQHIQKGSCAEHGNRNTLLPPCTQDHGFPSPGHGCMFWCIHGNAPQYLKELVHSVCSTNSYRILPQRTKSCTFGDQTIPEHMRAPQMIDSL